jgi:hypothetical protein
MRNVLISRNYRVINPPEIPEPPDEIEVTPDNEGESGGNMTQSDQAGLEPPRKKRQTAEINEEVDVDAPRTTHGIQADYKHLHDPFKNPKCIDEDEDSFMLEQYETYVIIAGDEHTSLGDAKKSLDWPAWQKSMEGEIKNLADMGTWELVEKPLDTVPITNKWCFIRKQNKEGEVVRHKG